MITKGFSGWNKWVDELCHLDLCLPSPGKKWLKDVHKAHSLIGARAKFALSFCFIQLETSLTPNSTVFLIF